MINLTHSKDDFFTRLPDTYEPIFNHDGLRRIRTNLFTQTNNLVNQKKFEKRIIKLEEFIDEMLAYELFDFKTLMQTRAEFSNYGQEFIKWKSLLVIFKRLFLFLKCGSTNAKFLFKQFINFSLLFSSSGEFG